MKHKFVYRIVPVTKNDYENNYFIEYARCYWFGHLFQWRKIYAKGSLEPLITTGWVDTVLLMRAFYNEPNFDPRKIEKHQPLVR